MRRHLILFLLVTLGIVVCWTTTASAVLLVNDTWQDGERYQPAGPNFVPPPPPYAENNGVTAFDADADGDLESAWFRGGAGTLDPVGPGGPLRGTTAAGSSSTWTTYFTDMEGDEVELANVGDQMLLTWVFTLDGVNAGNSSQDFRLAVVDSPNNRLTSDGSPGSAVYTGYAMFGNMGLVFGHNRPFDLMTRNPPSAALLSSSGAWASTGDNGTDDGTNGNTGYADGVEYTYTFLAERLAGDQLQITMRMDEGARAVGQLDDKGWLLAYYTDAAPASFKFDTFSIRPSKTEGTAAVFDTSLFRVERFSAVIPEPASLMLCVLGLVGLVAIRRR